MDKKILAVLIIVLVVCGAGLVVFNKFQEKPVVEESPKTGLVIESVEQTQNSFTDLVIKGYVNGAGWIAFEGQVGVVNLLNERGESLGFNYLMAVGDWMVSSPLNFQTTFRLATPERDEQAVLVFTNENPSGLPENDREFRMPITILAETAGTTIKVYFNNQGECSDVSEVKRDIPFTEGIARAALEQLLMGPTEQEKSQGFYTNINPGVKVQSLTIDENGLARADFSQELESTGGSCRVSAISAQIVQTLKQFPTIKNVIISINGRTEDILQP